VEGGAAGSGLEGRDECRAADGGASESWGPSSIVCTGISVLFIPKHEGVQGALTMVVRTDSAMNLT